MTSFKEKCDELLEQYHKKEITATQKITDGVSKEFGITPKTFRLRFKSLYGMTLTEKCKELQVPPKHIVIQHILACDNVKELWEVMYIPNGRKRNIFQELFGVSTFERAKAKLLLYSQKVNFNPSIDENKSLLVSQVLGDGSYSKERGALRLSHGVKQIGYAIWKASLINKAFPKTNPAGTTKVMTHTTQGHKYSSWSSGRLPDKLCSYLNSTPEHEMIKDLTPFGVFLYLMDDGYLNLDLRGRGNTYFEMYVHKDLVRAALVDMFVTYGIRTAVYNDVICIKDMVNAVKLYKNFIEPFRDMVSEDIKYKTVMKI